MRAAAHKQTPPALTLVENGGVVVRGVEVTEELYDLIVFCVHSFVRPTTELYALKHDDIVIEREPKRLLVMIRSGKTGFRIAYTMFAAVSAYERLRKRHPNAGGDDYIFLPEYTNRATARAPFSVNSICC